MAAMEAYYQKKIAQAEQSGPLRSRRLRGAGFFSALFHAQFMHNPQIRLESNLVSC
jgi:hypothetical protein